MKNFIANGKVITVIAPYALASGAGCLVGSLFGIAVGPAAAGAEVPIRTDGVYSMPKPGSQAWTVGARIYWDDAAKVATTVVGTNKLIGVAVAAVGAGAGETTGQVRLSEAFTL